MTQTSLQDRYAMLFPPHCGFAGDKFRTRYSNSRLDRRLNRPLVGDPRCTAYDLSHDALTKILPKALSTSFNIFAGKVTVALW
jgi:hypothetical protein